MADTSKEEAVVEMLHRLLSDALDAMNRACIITVDHGSPAGMEYIADWLNGRDSVSDEAAERCGDAPFPPDRPTPLPCTEVDRG